MVWAESLLRQPHAAVRAYSRAKYELDLDPQVPDDREGGERDLQHAKRMDAVAGDAVGRGRGKFLSIRQ